MMLLRPIFYRNLLFTKFDKQKVKEKVGGILHPPSINYSHYQTV